MTSQDRTRDRTTEDKSVYERQLEARLDMWKAEADKFAARLRKMGADTEAEAKAQLNTLVDRTRAAEAKLEELRASGTGAWKDIARGTEAAFEEMADAIKSATRRFAA